MREEVQGQSLISSINALRTYSEFLQTKPLIAANQCGVERNYPPYLLPGKQLIKETICCNKPEIKTGQENGLTMKPLGYVWELGFRGTGRGRLILHL